MTRNVFHHQVIHAIVVGNVVQCDDIQMIQSRSCASFAFESCGALIENLDCDSPAKAAVASFVYLPHAACAQQAKNFIWPESRAGFQWRGSCVQYGCFEEAVDFIGSL